jgi:glycosyltransferase involved in cell wall biosynthesis
LTVLSPSRPPFLPAASGYCVIIPTYNNARTLADVARRALAMADTVIVVDDGCTDGGPQTLNGQPVVLLRHARNRGKGAALRTGFRHARRLGYTHAVTLDSDGQHFPEDLPALVEESRLHPDAVVVGVRDMGGEHVPGHSHMGKGFSNFWLRTAAGVSVRDTQSGYRVYPLRHVTRARTVSRGFTFECEILVKLAWHGCPVREAPVRVHYPPKGERVSHYKLFWDTVWFTVFYLYANHRRLLWPVPNRRFVPRPPRAPGLRGWWGRMRELAELPKELEQKGSPWRRFKSLVRYLVREASTPGDLGFAAGIGAFIGCTPLIGFHWLLALYAATRLHINRVATLAATNVSFGPLTAVIALASIWLGKLMLGQTFLPPETLDWAVIGRFAAESLGAWLLGSFIIGLAAAFAVGFGTRHAVRALRRSRAGART